MRVSGLVTVFQDDAGPPPSSCCRVVRVATYGPFFPSLSLSRCAIANACDVGSKFKRAELKGTNKMGQTAFCKNLRFPAKFCGFLRKSAPPKCCNVFGETVQILNSTLQPEIIAKLIPKTLFHVTEMRFSKKIIPKTLVHVIL